MKDATGTVYKEANNFESSHPDYPLEKYFHLCDVEKFKDFKYFVDSVNKRSEWQRGWRDEYNYTEYGLNPNVEFFHPMITYDDRMVYIMENIVSLPDEQLSPTNKIGNTIISHFYGARGIHQIATAENDAKKAHVDFEDYFRSGERERVHKNLEAAVELKLPIYGTTELRTSLFGAANSYQQKRFGGERNANPGNIMDWVAGLLEDGMAEEFLASNSAEETFKILTRHAGIGSYYGYHCTTSNSVNPALNWDNDSTFVKPGPGAQYTLKLVFPEASNKLIINGDLVVWFRHNQKFFGFGDVVIHENAQNVYDYKGDPVLTSPQNEMKTYGSEVGLCQYGIFCKIRHDNKAIDRRKVSRTENIDFKNIIEGSIKIREDRAEAITLEGFMN